MPKEAYVPESFAHQPYPTSEEVEMLYAGPDKVRRNLTIGSIITAVGLLAAGIYGKFIGFNNNPRAEFTQTDDKTLKDLNLLIPPEITDFTCLRERIKDNADQATLRNKWAEETCDPQNYADVPNIRSAVARKNKILKKAGYQNTAIVWDFKEDANGKRQLTETVDPTAIIPVQP